MTIELGHWQPPPLRSWKWNVDGFAKGKPGPVGVGGVLCDDKGRIWAKFVALAGVRDSNEAEFLIIVFALVLSIDKDWLKAGSLLVKSDSKNALVLVKSACPWNLRYYGNKLRNFV